ncbi:MAG: hypothetical protein QF807_03855 [Candidatus Thalassarchaeaceae archaeon]|nr:hypothetical protein [Candidatus Thalassarchaeaceae archaeon]MDP7043131.1 hypothetical protein [Candidatus Thalassarchaeaceae archaeon]
MAQDGMIMKGRNTTLLLSLILLFSTAFAPNYLTYSNSNNHYTEEKSITPPCGGPSNTDSIVILPPGPVTLPADQSRIFTATLKNSNGDTLGGSPDWAVSDGSINPQGGGDAIYYPTSIGNHTVWACAANVVASVEVIVTMGDAESIELVGNKINLTADEVVELQVIEYDLHGNSGNMFVPSSQWTIPEGSSLHAVGGQPAIWTPGPIGNQSISVNAAGFSASWDVNVSRGVGVDLVIQKDRTVITSDESLDLSMSISDIRGNLWQVEGEWSTLAPQAMAWLTNNESHQTTFDGNLVGNWTVHAEYNGPENGNLNMSDEVTIDVRVGNIALVEIQGHDSTILTGDVLHLNPIATDLDGNIIEDATFNWSVEGASGIESIDEINQTFIPTTKGQHNILAESGGRPSSIRVQVEWSEPIDLNVTTSDGDWYLTVVTGETLSLHVQGLDVRGEWHSYNPNWTVDENFGSIEESGGEGDYLYHAASVNWTQLHAFVGENEFTILVYVTPGILDHIEVSVTDRGVQGESVPFTLRGFDISGNGVSMPICDVTVTSTAGRTECNEEIWTLYLDNGGEQQVVKATYENANGSGYIDVQPTLLGGQFGSSTQVIAGGAILISMLIAVVLIAVYMRVKRLANEYDEEEEEEVENTYAPQEMGQSMGQAPPPSGIMAPPPSGIMPPPQGMAMPMPPSPMLGTEKGKRLPPSPPPPAFMFGTGITSNSSSAQPIPGVFVRSDSKYGWGDPNQQPMPQGYGWEQIGGTSVGVQPAPQQPQSEYSEAPPPRPEELGEEKPSALSSALSLFPESTSNNDAESESDEDVVVREEEPEVEEEVQDIPEEVDSPPDDDSDSPTEEYEWADDSEDEQTESNEAEGDKWDSWDDEWESDGVADAEDEDSSTEEGSEEVDDAVTDVVEPGLGPCTEKGDILKPLPGTKSGESGWYFDSNGKPSLWEFRSIGWERIK